MYINGRNFPFFSVERGTRDGLWGGFPLPFPFDFRTVDGGEGGDSDASMEISTCVKVHVFICVFVIFVFFSFWSRFSRCCLSCIYFWIGFPDKKLVRRNLKFFQNFIEIFSKYSNGGTVRFSLVSLFLQFSRLDDRHPRQRIQDGARRQSRRRRKGDSSAVEEEKRRARARLRGRYLDIVKELFG